MCPPAIITTSSIPIVGSVLHAFTSTRGIPKASTLTKKCADRVEGDSSILESLHDMAISPQKKGNNMYSAYVAKNFSKIKQASDPGTSAVDVMKKIAAMWHVEKTAMPACHS
eukprot:jgi/Picre1/32783/NNA_008114.t1